MLKFFRKYNKILLVTLGSGLMIMFLLPGTEIFMPDPARAPIGEVAGQTIVAQDRITAEAEMRTIAHMGFGGVLPQDPLTWLLMVHEARQHGIYVSNAQVEGTLAELREAQVDPEAVAGRVGVGEGLLRQAVRHLIMVDELQSMIVGVRRPSESRIAHFARDTHSSASADVIVIDAAHFFDAIEEPTEEELQSHFEQYRDQPPGESHPYGFGYFLPPRVQLEYLAVPRERVREAIEVDEAEAYRFYLDNEERYTAERVGVEDVPEDHPAGQPLPYRTVREQVYDDFRDHLTDRRHNQIVRWVASQLTTRERRLPVAQQGYRDFPEDHVPISFEELAERTEDRFGIRPEIVRIDDRWLGPDDVTELAGFGDAYLEASNREYPIETYVFSAREVEPDADNPLLALLLQVGVSSRPVEDDANNSYIFRLTDADVAREPRDLDEVREEVVEDVRRLRAYELMQDRAQEFRERALTDGLDQLAEEFNASVINLDEFRGRVPENGRLHPPDLPGIGRSADFVDNIFNVAQQAYEEAGSIEEADEEQVTTAVGLDQRQALAVARIRGYQPLNREIYQMLRPTLPQQLQMADAFDMIVRYDPFAPDVIRQRVGFRDIGARDDDEFDDLPLATP